MSEHPVVDELAAYALDALPTDETRFVAAHLARCAQCRDELTALRESAAALATLAPAVTPPVGMRARVLARAVASRTGEVMDGALVRPPVPRRWTLLATAAGVVLAVGLGAALFAERSTNATLADRLARAEALAQERGVALAGRDSLLARVLGPEVEIATLAATGSTPSLRLYWDRPRGEMVVSVRRLPPASAGRTYQLWGIGAGGVPTSLGTFDTASDGTAVVTLRVAVDERFDVSAVTDEPSGGSVAPTSAPFLVGPWSTAGR